MLAPLLVAALLAMQCAKDPPTDSATAPVLEPAGHIGDDAIDESSGIICLDGAFFTHNDSGDDPVLYRSLKPTFPAGATEHLPLEGAEAVDWEDITVLEGDLIVGDIGDNRRRRPHLTLYRARYEPGGPQDHPPADPRGRLRLVATYPFRYPDARHDAEALFAIEDTLYIVSKAREEKVTNVYRFDRLLDVSELAPGEINRPTLIATLDIGEGEQVTAGTYHPATERVVLLTYTHLLQYPRAQLTGAPAKRTLIAARQCEAICFHEEVLILTNEQRDVFEIPGFISRDLAELMPPRGKALLPRLEGPVTVSAQGLTWSGSLLSLPLHNAWADERIEVAVSGDQLLLRGELFFQESFKSTHPSPSTESGDDRPGRADSSTPRLGSVLLVALAGEPTLMLDGSETIVALGRDEGGAFRVWSVDMRADPLRVSPLEGAHLNGSLSSDGGRFAFEGLVPLPENLRTRLETGIRFDVRGLQLHEPEVRFSGIDLMTIRRPYTWGLVRVAS